jgi:hypothetical protein
LTATIPSATIGPGPFNDTLPTRTELALDLPFGHVPSITLTFFRNAASLRLLLPLLAENRKTVLGGLNPTDRSPTPGDDERYDPHIHRISFVSPRSTTLCRSRGHSDFGEAVCQCVLE